jgi:hypothetical protein
MHLTGVCLMGMHLTGVYLTGMHLTGVYLAGMCLMGSSWAPHGHSSHRWDCVETGY